MSRDVTPRSKYNKSERHPRSPCASNLVQFQLLFTKLRHFEKKLAHPISFDRPPSWKCQLNRTSFELNLTSYLCSNKKFTLRACIGVPHSNTKIKSSHWGDMWNIRGGPHIYAQVSSLLAYCTCPGGGFYSDHIVIVMITTSLYDLQCSYRDIRIH